ncbi:putative RNA-directed DNA polymerase from transposon X-element [Trichonephila clavipes]|nr:putative RNA-directed DNA polymerase from transposon X-element [Trichonephila clavipes]
MLLKEVEMYDASFKHNSSVNLVKLRSSPDKRYESNKKIIRENFSSFGRRIKTLCDKFGRSETTHEKVLGLITDEDGYDKEFTEGENYRDIFLTLRTKLENRISKLSESVNIHNETIVSSDLETVSKNRKFKLPKLEFMKFSGDAREYLSFWSQFSKTHEDTDIVSED